MTAIAINPGEFLTEGDFAEGVLDIAETAQFCRVSTREVYKLMERDGLPWRKIGRHRKVPRVGLRRWLATHGPAAPDAA